ncbi:DBH-like monooxygenase protein 2 homolog [Etheostoma spectabile]|uniref:DBH-like monooxygenase protein 2 homolog n=1 Tax=Etheostoma spectabile TaxID=54343 RepID=UPI0013AF28DE|nr:DBH-like monooxygenase protein 2 homolog [Etheostoma spectabile]
MHSLLSFLYLFSVWTKGAKTVDPALPFMEYLDQNRLVSLNWGFDNPQGNITFKLTVNTTGWVSFGFSPNGGMKGSDMVTGGVRPNGIYFTDEYATGNSKPLVDEQQSYTLLSMTESDGQTIMTFRRSIQSCDGQDFHITDKPIKLIYAYGKTDEITYHGDLRGTKEVNLLNYKSRTTSTNLNYLSATVENITIPQTRTYYHCKVMQFPNLKTKHHIYQIEPVIENVDMVHHMLLHRCPTFVVKPYDKPCFMGDIGDACFGVVAAWGVGAGAYELPENVGIPVGSEDTFYRLEIHYNNQNRTAGRTDSSGMKLHYTAQLRQYDAGILTTGMLPLHHISYNIPPKATQFHTYGVCNTTLFSKLLNPVPELQVFAIILHTHLAGRKVRVGQYRNGEQIDFLGLDENFNFEFQQVISLGNIKTIKQSDEIAVECTYSTTDRTNVTKMGLATTDEMCLAFLFYYPAIKINTCVSHPNTSTYKDQDDIAAQERLLKKLPQIQYISDDNTNSSFNLYGTVREMMKTPSDTCHNNNAASRLSTSWIMDPAGIVLLLLWIAMM